MYSGQQGVHLFHLKVTGMPSTFDGTAAIGFIDLYMPSEILITGVKKGQRKVLTRHEPSVGKETLGVVQAMDGNNRDEILHIRKKDETFAESMRTGYLSKTDAWFTLTATIMTTMKYPMAVTTLTEPEWEDVIVPIL